MRSVGPGDDQARFLADLRALRDTAAISFEELAARAHYPSDLLKEAENGPRLPSLPILVAYVRACDGNVPEWEERWRRLGDEIRADPNLPVRPAGASPAAMAGARAGIGVSPPEAYDPERIRAALRTGPSHPAGGTRPAEPGTADTGTGFRTFEAADGLGAADLAGGPGTMETADGLRDGFGTTQADSGWGTSEAGGRFETAEAGGWFGASDLGAGAGREAGTGWEAAAAAGSGGVHRTEGWAAGEAAERDRPVRDEQFPTSWSQDREPAARTGNGTFSWREQTPQASRTTQAPSPAQTPQNSPIPQATWTLGDALAAEPGGGGQAGRPRTGVDLAQGPEAASAAATQPRPPAAAAAPAQSRRQRNRAFSWRLVAVIVAAALLGSVLMLVFR